MRETFYFDREEKPGYKPREIVAQIDRDAKTVTISDTSFGPRGGLSLQSKISLSLADWDKIVQAYQEKKNVHHNQFQDKEGS